MGWKNSFIALTIYLYVPKYVGLANLSENKTNQTKIST